MNNKIVLEIKGLSSGYKTNEEKIIKDINLTIPQGRKVAIVGMNGCGKTTLLRTITGQLKYDGQILINGKDLKGMSRREIARNVSVLMQHGGSDFGYTVEETVKLGSYAVEKVFDKGKDQNKVKKILEDTGLTKVKDKAVNELSGGQQQKVFLARTFAQDAPIMLLDEPMNHLDLKSQLELTKLLSKWSADEGHTLIGIYHDISMARMLSDLMIFMKDGKIVCVGNTDEIDFKKVLSEVYDMDVYSHMNDIASLWK